MDNMGLLTERETRDRSWSGPPRLRSAESTDTSEEIEPELINRAEIRRVVMPSRVDPGERFSITGRIGMRSVFAGQRPVRVTIDAPWMASPITRQIGELGYNDEETFSFLLTAPNNPGATYDISVIVEWRQTIGGWDQSDQTTRTIATGVPPAPSSGDSDSGSGTDSGSGSGSGTDSGGTSQPSPSPEPEPSDSSSPQNFLASLSSGEKAALAIGGVAVATALMGGGGGGGRQTPRRY